MDWLLNRPIAHRGLCQEAIRLPENSMDAFRVCMETGNSIELDLHIMQDGEVAVFHDETLERMCGVHGTVASLNKSILTRLYLRETQNTIPLLQHVLEEIKGRVGLLLELKTEKFDARLEKKVLDLVADYKGEVALQSFHPQSVYYTLKHAPDRPSGLLSYDYGDCDLPHVKKLLLKHAPFLPLMHPDFVALHWQHLSSPLASLARYLKIPILSWTIRDEQSFKQLKDRCQNIIFEGVFGARARSN